MLVKYSRTQRKIFCIPSHVGSDRLLRDIMLFRQLQQSTMQTVGFQRRYRTVFPESGIGGQIGIES